MDKKIKLVHVIPSMNTGGRESVVLHILDHLNRDRFDVRVMCLSNEGSLYDHFISKNVPIYFLRKNAGFTPRVYLKLYRHFTKNDYHIVHSHNPGAFLYGAVAAKLAGTPVIINSEHGYGNIISWRKKAAESFLMNTVYKTLAVSKELRDTLSSRPFVRKDKIQVLYNGIDSEKINSFSHRDEIRKTFGVYESQLVIGTVGRLATVKDHETLIRCFKLIYEVFSQSKLVIVGEGPEKNKLRSLVTELGLSDKVLFTGERRDVPALLSGMDIFVLSSISEGTSITLLEAMAAGIPVVATSVGGNKEVIENGVTGLLIPPKDPEMMAEAIHTLFSDKMMAQSFSAAGKKMVAEKFSIKNMVRTLENLYEASVKGKYLQ